AWRRLRWRGVGGFTARLRPRDRNSERQRASDGAQVPVLDCALMDQCCLPRRSASFVKKPILTLDTLNGRRTRGVTIAMDDFGRGHSSLSYQGTIRSTGSSLAARSSPPWRTRRTREPLAARSRNWRTASGWEQRGGIENARAA